jgi:four helix bundle protein
LASRLRCAGPLVSVPANIAEAFSKKTKPDKASVPNISQASLEELRYYFILAGDLNYLTAEQQRSEPDDVARMLGAYVRSVHSSS